VTVPGETSWSCAKSWPCCGSVAWPGTARRGGAHDDVMSASTLGVASPPSSSSRISSRMCCGAASNPSRLERGESGKLGGGLDGEARLVPTRGERPGEGEGDVRCGLAGALEVGVVPSKWASSCTALPPRREARCRHRAESDDESPPGEAAEGEMGETRGCQAEPVLGGVMRRVAMLCSCSCAVRVRSEGESERATKGEAAASGPTKGRSPAPHRPQRSNASRTFLFSSLSLTLSCSTRAPSRARVGKEREGAGPGTKSIGRGTESKVEQGQSGV